MLPFMIFLLLFILLRLLAGWDHPVERFSAVAYPGVSDRQETPTGFVHPCGYAPSIYYSGPTFADRYEEWHYYRHHLHNDELLGHIQNGFREEFEQGILGQGEVQEQEVIEGTWRST